MSLDAPVRMFLAAITSSTADGDRWKYSWAEVYQETAGYEGFTATTTRPRASSAYSPERYARNLAEQSASWTGLPVSAGTVVPMLGVECGQDAEFWLGPEPGGGILNKGTLVADETLISGDNSISVTPAGGASPVDVHVYEGAKNVRFDPDDTKSGHTIWYMADVAGDYRYVSGFGSSWYYGDDP